MNVLAISSMYPSAAQPVHAVFVEQRIFAIARHAKVVVVSPIPWFPLGALLPRYAHRRHIPRREVRGGVEVHYPRFLSFPKILKPLDGFFLFVSCWNVAQAIGRDFPIDLIDAHLAYPDGWGGILLGKLLRRPVSVTLRGHDLNDLPQYPVRRRQVAWALQSADVVIAVADALRDSALALGAPPERTLTAGNGVDAQKFFPRDRAQARKAVGILGDGPLVLSVGHLVVRKGFHHLVRAFPRVLAMHPNARLAIVGAPGEEGNAQEMIRRTIEECGLQERVILVGAVEHEKLSPWYSAADVFCLPSEKEGRANVLLESLACGTPVVATRVWGTPEILCDDSLGILVDSIQPEPLGTALLQALARPWDREKIVASSRRFSWETSARAILDAWHRAQNAAAQDAAEKAKAS